MKRASSVEGKREGERKQGGWWKYVLGVGVFFGVTAVFFSPAVFEGLSIRQGDHIKASGMGGGERTSGYAAEAPAGEYNAWGDAMFCGLPYVAGMYGSPAPSLPSYQLVTAPFTWIGWENAAMTLLGMVCFYVLLLVCGASPWVALVGGLAYALGSYNIIVTVAGHVVKAYAIAYMPLALGGMVLLFRGKYLWGTVLFMLGVALVVGTSHIQIAYYLAMLCILFYVGWVIHSVVKGVEKASSVLKVTGLLSAGVVLAILPNAQRMVTDWEMSKLSIRGPSELTMPADGAGVVEPRSTGLDKGYAFQWSYGRAELLNLLIPNALGGESGGYLPADSRLAKELKRRGGEVPKEGIQTYTYWGDKPFTSGPAYMGAVVCFLFVLGMFVLKTPLKWWLVGGATLLTLMALGRNLDVFNTWLFHHLPLYNKFRTVEMALVIPGLVLPLIGFLGLHELTCGKVSAEVCRRGLLWALGLTGGLCLVIWLAPEIFLNFRSPQDAMQLSEFPSWYTDGLISGRRSLAKADALRSLLFIVAASSSVYFYLQTDRKQSYALCLIVALGLLGAGDLWGVDRRYLNERHYMRQRAVETYKAGQADKLILSDTTLHYRVLGLDNPWQDTQVSFFHRSIGGYHAVKLRRYQEFIDRYLDVEHMRLVYTLQASQGVEALLPALSASKCLNMLNMRYVIYHPEASPIVNPYALGNGWFVEEVRWAENANEELEAVGEVDLRRTAVTHKRNAGLLAGLNPLWGDSTASVELVEYRPPYLRYVTRSQGEGLAVFSEIYYPGWKAYIDGEEVTPLQVDWLLRGLRIPEGSHEVVFRFEPGPFEAAVWVSSLSSFLLLLLLLGAGVWGLRNHLSEAFKKFGKQ
ncbi:MAG: YfhO family protein [Tannerellaceae bacterium]|jgi:hypothetical protein|nr:YfhO family protein [Tannerellaceae bacterium]